MPFGNSLELQAAVALWLDRSDLTARIPDFITLAEATIRRRVRGRHLNAELTLTGTGIDLPTLAAQGARTLRLNTATPEFNGPIPIVPPEQLDYYRPQFVTAGRPVFAAIQDGTLMYVPEVDQSYDAILTYDLQLLPLADYNNNDILTRAPDIYLYGVLLEAAPYLEHDERIPTWKQRFDAAIDELNLAREREETGARPQRVRLARVFG